jgi:hypothetical protein
MQGRRPSEINKSVPIVAHPILRVDWASVEMSMVIDLTKKTFELTQTRERVLARVPVLLIVQLAVDAASSLPYAFLMHGT